MLSLPVRALLSCLAPVLAQEPAELAGPVALADTRALLLVGDRLRSHTLGRISDIDLRQLFTLEDAGSTGAWVDTQPVSAGRDEVALARRLHAIPHVHAQVQAGELSLKTAGLIAAALTKAQRLLDRPDALIGGQPGEPLLTNLIVEGVLQLVAGGRGGFEADDTAFDALLAALVGVVQLPLSQFARLERALVILAQELPTSMLRDALDRLLDALLPQRLDDACARTYDNRAFKLTRKSDGSGYTITRGDVTLELGEYLAAIIAAQRATDPDNPSDTAGWLAQHTDTSSPTEDPGQGSPTGNPGQGSPTGNPGQGGPTGNPGQAGPTGNPGQAGPTGNPGQVPEPAAAPRSRVQQDHDALLIALRLLLDSGALGLRHKVSPHLAITVSLDALNNTPGSLPALSRTTGTTLPTTLVRRVLCNSGVTRLVLNLRGRITASSHTERTATAHERLQVAIRWGHRCAEAGCPSPPGTPLIPHHGNPWHMTATTAVDDTVPFCDTTHHHLHVHGRTITLRDGRRLGPDGWLPPHRQAEQHAA